MNRRFIPAVLIIAVIVSAWIAFMPDMNAVASPMPTKWSLVMSIRVNAHVDDYVIDHDLTLGDCFAALADVRPYHQTYADLTDTSVHVTYACDLR